MKTTQKKGRSIKSYLITTLLIAVLLAAIIIVIIPNKETIQEQTEKKETELEVTNPFDLEGYSISEISLEGTTLLVKKDCKALIMPIADTQALAIYYGLKNESYARPLTQDLIQAIIDGFSIEVKAIKISGAHDGIYTANIVLQQGNKILNLDARPSDAVAVALKTGSNIYIKDEILKKFGEKVC